MINKNFNSYKLIWDQIEIKGKEYRIIAHHVRFGMLQPIRNIGQKGELDSIW